MPQFYKKFEESYDISIGKLKITQVEFPEESRLLREWLASKVPVFFDFTNYEELKYSKLWFLIPNISNDTAYLTPISRDVFIEIHKNNYIEEITNNLKINIRNYQNYIKQREQEEMNRRINQVWNRMCKIKRPRRRF